MIYYLIITLLILSNYICSCDRDKISSINKNNDMDTLIIIQDTLSYWETFLIEDDSTFVAYEPHYQIGLYHQRKGELEEAERALTKALECYNKPIEKSEETLSDTLKAKQNEKSPDELLYNLGKICLELQHKEGYTYLKQLLENNPTYQSQIALLTGGNHPIKRLTYTKENENYIAWSNDGQKLLIADEYTISLIDTNGNLLQILYEDKQKKKKKIAYPSFFPDDESILFVSIEDNKCNLLMLELANNLLTDITPEFEDSLAKIEYPSISPDGEEILFTYRPAGKNRQLYSISIHSPRPKEIPIIMPAKKMEHSSAKYLADGKRLVMESFRDWNWEIYLKDLSNGSEINLTNNIYDDFAPFPNPDNSIIFFTSQRDGNFELYQTDIKSLISKRLTLNPSSDSYAVCSSDGRNGRRLAFISNREDNNYEVYIMQLDKIVNCEVLLQKLRGIGQ